MLKSLSDSTLASLQNVEKANYFISKRRELSEKMTVKFEYLKTYSDQIKMYFEVGKKDSTAYFIEIYENLLYKYKNQISEKQFQTFKEDIRIHRFNLFRQTNRFDEAIKILTTHITQLKGKSNYSKSELSQLYFDYHNLCHILTIKGSYQKALEYEEKAIEILETLAPEKLYYKILPLTTIGSLYNKLGDTLNKKKYFEKAYNCYELAKKQDPSNVGLDMNADYLLTVLTEQAILNNDLNKGDYYLHQLFEIEERNKLSKETYFLLLGKVAIQRNDFVNAKLYLDNSLLEISTIWSKKYKVPALYNFSKLYLKNLQIDSALKYIQKSLIAASRSFDSPDFRINPSVSDAFSQKELLDIINLKADILLRLSAQSPDIYLPAAYDVAHLGIQLIDSIRIGYTSDFDKLFLISKAYTIFEKYIIAGLAMSKLKKDDNYKLSAYLAVEQSRAVILLEGLKGVEAETILFENDRNSLFQLRSELTQLERKRNDEKVQNLASVEFTKIQNQIFEANQKFEDLVKSFEIQYPAYYKLKFEKKLINIEQIKTLLQPNQTLVEYFVGDSSLFVFIIKPNFYDIVEIKKEFPLDDWVKLLRGALNSDNYQTQADVYADISFRLYEKLVKPFKDQLSEDLIIVPDGILGYIPFEALLTQKPVKAFRFHDHAYLLREHSISYSFSATLLREMIQKKHSNPSNMPIIAYAPFYSNDTTLLAKTFSDDLSMRRNLSPLSNSGEEAYRIAKAMGGEAIVGKEATEQKFIETAQSASIIHLATHGQADDKSGDYSFLAFAPNKDSIQNQLLYVRDLYNLTLNADMVVLSACETGIGKLQRGEGIISLARAFAYAGAKSIVTSLWSVNDAKTKDLMLLFYKYLKKGKSKDAALRQAKLDFIDKNTNPNAHPFFWAGFIGIGDMTKLR